MRGQYKGAFTVEMAIIFPIILLTIVAVLGACMTHYQNIMTSTAAMQTASRGAAYWDRMGGEQVWDFESTAENPVGTLAVMDFETHDPYRYLLDGKAGNKIDNLEKYYNWIQKQTPSIFEETNSQAEFEKKGFILAQYVSVTVEKEYLNPFAELLERFGLEDAERNVITAKAPLNTPGEFIRNASFCYDLVKGYGYKGE